MTLNSYKIGQLVEVIDERNDLGIRDFYGININKEFMPTAANTDGLDETKYKVVRKNRFVYSGMQTGRDECIRLSMYTEEKPIIVSPAYTTFEVVATDTVIPLYFFMRFLSKEKDRYGAFCSDGSIRSNLDWDVFCDIEIELPSIEIQQKYVDIYNAMIENQKSYERGLEDLKLVCNSALDKIKKENCIKLGKIIEKKESKNINNFFGKEDVRGITNKKQFDATKADLRNTDLSKFLIVNKDEFAYNSRTDGRDMLVLALNREEKSVIVTFNYNVFGIKGDMKNFVNNEYLYTLFKRSEFDRKVRFDSWGSSQELFSWESLCDLDIPFPSIEIQNSIASINDVYINRSIINEKLKSQIRDICPILIKGSIEEAKRS